MRRVDTAEIVAATQSRAWHTALPPQLERLYEAGTVETRNRYLAYWVLFVLGLNLFYFLFDALYGASQAVILLHAADCGILAICGAGVLAQPPRWVASVLVITAQLANTTLTVWIGLHSPAPFGDRVITTVGFMILFVNATWPLRFRDSVIMSVLSVAAFSWMLLGPINARHIPEWDNVMNAAVLGLVSAGVVQRREVTSRRAFLLSELDRLRMADMALASQTDSLTALPNRRAFDAALARQWELTRETGALLGLLMIDVDRFKSLNDLRGHAEGDRCLRNVAAVMDAAVRPGTDFLARYGGEEFAVVLRDVNESAAVEIAERLRRRVEAAALPHPVSGVVTVSIGSAVAEPARQDGGAEALVKAADEALYDAKRAGRNGVVLWRPGGSAAAGDERLAS